MAKNSIRDFDNTSGNNTDIQSVDISEGCSPAGINNAIREMMADLADVNDGTVALVSPAMDSADINGGTIDGTVIGGTTPAAGTFTTLTASDDVNFDSNTLFVDASANAVGVGTSSPSNKLDIKGTVGFEATNSTNKWLAYTYTDNTLRVNYNGAGADEIVVTSGGSVGIGTDTPDTLLELRGADPILTIRDTNTSSASSNATLRLAETGASDTLDAYWDIKADGGQLQFIDNWNEGGGTGTRVIIDDSGSVGIGTGSDAPQQKLDVRGEIAISNSTTSYWNLNRDDSTGALTFSDTGGTPDMVLDTSGNLLVSKTSSDTTTVGVEARSNGQLVATLDGGTALIANRKTSDGDVVKIMKDGSTVGSIFSSGGQYLGIGNDDVGLLFLDVADDIRPWNTSTNAARDDAIDLGNSDARFDDIFATNGTIQTSDQNEKNTITDSDLGLDFIGRLAPKSYIFNNKTRTHYGLIAQDVESVLSDIGKTTSEFAGFIKDDISDDQDGSSYRYGLRYTEFVGPLIQAVKELKTKVETLETENATQATQIADLITRVTALEAN